MRKERFYVFVIGYISGIITCYLSMMVNTKPLERSGKVVENLIRTNPPEVKRKFTVYSIIPDAFVTAFSPNRNWQQHIRRQFNFEYSLPPNIQYSEVLLDGNKYWAKADFQIHTSTLLSSAPHFDLSIRALQIHFLSRLFQLSTLFFHYQVESSRRY